MGNVWGYYSVGSFTTYIPEHIGPLVEQFDRIETNEDVVQWLATSGVSRAQISILTHIFKSDNIIYKTKSWIAEEERIIFAIDYFNSANEINYTEKIYIRYKKNGEQPDITVEEK